LKEICAPGQAQHMLPLVLQALGRELNPQLGLCQHVAILCNTTVGLEEGLAVGWVQPQEHVFNQVWETK
jgi:hypothetical protein